LLKEGCGFVLKTTTSCWTCFSIFSFVFKSSWVILAFTISTKENSFNCFLIRSPSQKSSFGFAWFKAEFKSLKAVSAFPKRLSSVLKSRFKSLVKTTVLSEIYFKKLSLFSVNALFSTLGIMLILLIFSVESCVSTSKVRMLSTSSSKNSMR